MPLTDPDHRPPEPGAAPHPPAATWALVVVGWLFGSLSLAGLRPRAGLDGSQGRPRPGAPVAWTLRGPGPPTEDASSAPGRGGEASAASVGTVDLLRSPPRELRRLPGIGPLRAAAIAERRWRLGGEPFPLREVHGIGERTEARALEALGDGRASGWGGAAPASRDGPR